MGSRPDVEARHRAQSSATRRRILDSALELLADEHWTAVSLEQVTARSGLTRTAFYRHFADRQELLLALLAELGGVLESLPSPWHAGEGEDPAAALETAVRTLVATYARHRRLLVAMAEAATSDPEIRAQYLALVDRLVADSSARIAADVAAGRSRVADPTEVTRALIWMNEALLRDEFAPGGRADEQRAADALVEVWVRVVYG